MIFKDKACPDLRFRPKSCDRLYFLQTSFDESRNISMANRNTNNVYKGADSLRNYFDPDQQPMIPMVELPRKLNPFYEDGVRIYAKMMSTLPANNVKSLPGMFSWVVLLPRRFHLI